MKYTKKIEKLKSLLNECMEERKRCLAMVDEGVAAIDESKIWDEIDILDNKIEECEFELDTEIIKPYLTNLGVRTYGDSHFSATLIYKIARYKDIRYLEYIDEHFDSHEGCRKCNHGIVMYDTKGNVIFENPNCEKYTGDLEPNKDILFEELKPEDAFVYIDDEDIIINECKTFSDRLCIYDGETPEVEEDVNVITNVSEGNADADFYGYIRYIHFKKKADVYTPVTVFKNYSMLGTKKFDFKMLKTNNDEKLCRCFYKLYSMKDAKLLNRLRFDDILDKTCRLEDMPNFGIHPCDFLTKLEDIIKKNNLLVGFNRFRLCDYEKADTMIYLDTKGNIVSDLYYYVNLAWESPKYQPDRIDSIEVTEDTYYDSICEMSETAKKYRKQAEEKKAAEAERENKMQNEKETKRKIFLMNSYKNNKNNS